MRCLFVFFFGLLCSLPAAAHGDIDVVYILGGHACLVVALSMYWVLRGIRQQQSRGAMMFYGVVVLCDLLIFNMPYGDNKIVLTWLCVAVPVLAWLLAFVFVMRK